MRKLRVTPRERQVLDQLRTGTSNKDIARDLHISEQAVKALVSRLLLKYEVSNRTTLAAVADAAELGHAREIELFDAEGKAFTKGQDPTTRVARGEHVDEDVTFGPERERARLRLDPRE